MLINLFLLVAFLQYPISTVPDAKTIVSKSIAYHDPNHHWEQLQAQLHFVESRPNGSTRHTSIQIDNKQGNFCMSRKVEGKEVYRHIVSDSCYYAVDGVTSLDNEKIHQYKLNDERSFTMRNYYLYLWGLPMKLNDNGTIIENEAKIARFNNTDAYEVKVTYDENTGSDVWFFYFNPETYALIGYKFYHANGEGEYITLSDLETVSGVKMPKNRSWYINSDSKFLGTDTLDSFTTALHEHN